MLKKTLALILTALMALSFAALAETVTYADRGGAFTLEYDDAQFDVDLEDYADEGADADLVLILTGKVSDWGMVDLQFMRLAEVFSDEVRADLESALEVTLEKGEWNGFEDVYSYTFGEDGVSEQTRIIQYDDAHTLSVSAITDVLDDAETAAQRDAAVSAVLESLKITAR